MMHKTAMKSSPICKYYEGCFIESWKILLLPFDNDSYCYPRKVFSLVVLVRILKKCHPLPSAHLKNTALTTGKLK